MYRCFIRFSVDADTGTLTTYMSNSLVRAGFVKVGTGEYHAGNLTAQQLGEVMTNFWSAVENPVAAFPGAAIPPAARIDHIWTYSCTQ